MQNQYPSHDGNFHTDYLHGEVQQNLPAHYSACSSTIHPSPGPTSQENQALPATFTTASSQPLHSNSGAWNQPSPYGIASLYNNMQPAVLHNQLNQAWLNFGNITSVPVGNNYNGVSETPQRTERRQYVLFRNRSYVSWLRYADCTLVPFRYETGMTAKYQGYYQPWTSCSSGPPGDLVAFQSTIDWSLPPTHYPQSDQKSELLPHAQLPYPQASPEPMTEGFIDTRQITTTDDDSDVHSGDQTTRFPYLGDTTSDHGDQSTVSISDTSDDSVAAVAPEVSEANQPVG